MYGIKTTSIGGEMRGYKEKRAAEGLRLETPGCLYSWV